MKIKIEIDVPKYTGGTDCCDCPIEKYSRLCVHGLKYCKEYDLSRIEVKKLEETMKARIKATGEIIEISEDCSYLYAENYDKSYNLNELEFLDVKEKSLSKNEPDYLEKLKHQYAGQFLQGMIIGKPFTRDYIEVAYNYAAALINKLKEEEK